MIPTRESTPRPEPGVCGCGPCIYGEPSASESQWSETACEGADFLFNLIVGFAVGVCTCVIRDCTHRLVSREIIVAAEQIRSLPEFEHGIAMSRDTRTMADTARSFLARDGGKSARFGCAGAPRNKRCGCLRTDEQYAASMGCSDSVCVSWVVRFRSQRLGAEAVRQELRIIQILAD